MAATTKKSKKSTKDEPLTQQEIEDVKQSLQELKEGKGKTFKSSKDFFKYLKSLPDEY
jgi:hypothetical protein